MVNDFYMANKVQNNELAWDYQDLRQDLNDGIKEVFGDQIWLEINNQFWFDHRLMEKEELLEFVVSFFVLGSDQVFFG
mgnify:CR=1 FL=1